MANGGWYGTDVEWKRLQAPLSQIDPTIESFATRHELSVVRNERESIGRSMRWGGNPSALLQLYLVDAASLTWNLWACCSEDRGDERYWKTQFLIQQEEIVDLAPRLDALLEQGFRKLSDWCDHTEQLIFATKIARQPDL